MNKNKAYTNENVVRIIAGQIVVIMFLSLHFNWLFLLPIVAADFALRAFTYLPSPLATLAKLIVSIFKLKQKPIFAGPKKFAASIGFVFSLLTFILFLFQFNIAAYILGVILIFFATLECVFQICVGCHIHSSLVAPLVNKRDN